MRSLDGELAQRPQHKKRYAGQQASPGFSQGQTIKADLRLLIAAKQPREPAHIALLAGR